MTYKNYNLTNQAVCTPSVPITTSAGSIVGAGNYGRFPSTNFVIRVTEYNSSGVATARENMYISARSGSTFTIANRAYESVPIDDSASSNSAVALEFTTNAVIELVLSAEVIEDIQTEVQRIGDDYLTKAVYYQDSIPFFSSSEGADAYVITDPNTTTYQNGKTYKMQADIGNTGASTFKVNALTAYAIKKVDNGAFVDTEDGDIVANQVIYLTYISAESCFQLSAKAEVPVVSGAETLTLDKTRGEDTTSESDVLLMRRGRGSAPNISSAYASNTASNSPESYGYSSTVFSTGQSIRVDSGQTLSAVTFKLRKQGTPTGKSIQVLIYDGTSQTTVLSECYNGIDDCATDLTTTLTEYTFFLKTPITGANQTVYVKLHHIWATSTSHYWQVDKGSSYANGTHYHINSGATWSDQSDDLFFKAHGLQSEDSSKAWIYDGTDYGITDDEILGLELTNGSADASTTLTMLTNGAIVSGFSGLTIGEEVTRGGARIGVAMSSTEVLIDYDGVEGDFISSDSMSGAVSVDVPEGTNVIVCSSYVADGSLWNRGDLVLTRDKVTSLFGMYSSSPGHYFTITWDTSAETLTVAWSGGVDNSTVTPYFYKKL